MWRRVGAVVGLAGLVVAPAALAQRPSVSPVLDHAIGRDTTVIVWLFARPGVSLDRIASIVREVRGRVRHRSRWLRAVSAAVSGTQLADLAGRRELRHIQPVALFRRPAPPRSQAPPGLTAVPGCAPAPGDTSLYGSSAMPLRRLHLFPLVDRGYEGQGIRIAVLDAGFETELPAFAGATVVAQHDFVFGDSVVRNDSNDVAGASQHGTEVWSLFAADAADTVVGIARQAEYILAKTEDIRSETRVEEDNYVAALEWADSLGAKIVSSSLGYRTFDGGTGYSFSQLNGDVAVTTVAADMAAARGMLVVTAMGNFGPADSSIVTPADGDSLVAVGAEDSIGTIANFSSRGPTADGRIKPDVTAPGVAVCVYGPGGPVRGDGTSFSTPLVAAGAALLRQIHPQLGPMDILDALRRSASNRGAPNLAYGWGRPDFLLAATFPRSIVVTGPLDSTLSSVTPTFAWSAVDAASFALPIRYRLRVARDTGLTTLLLDSTLTDQSVTLLTPQLPGTQLAFDLTATAADSVVVHLPAKQLFTAPPWIQLLTFNDPGGSTTRALRPRFQWRSPPVASPPGPFHYDVAVVRADDDQVEIQETDLTATEFTPPQALERNTPYRWRVVARLDSDSVAVTSQGSFVVIDDSVPAVTTLFQNFPNPFPNRATGQTATCVWFDLASEGVVRLDVLDLRGHLVRNLVPGSTDLGPFLRAGRYGRPAPAAQGTCDPALEWDGTGADGQPVPAGVYLLKLSTPDGVFFKRAVFMGSAH